MRYSAREYARALYETVCKQTDSEAERTINKFVSDMKDNGRLALLPEILKEMPDAIKTVDGVEDVTVESAYEMESGTISNALKALGKNKGEVEVTLRKNPELIGGIKIKGRDTVLDATVKGRLMKLREAFSRPVQSE